MFAYKPPTEKKTAEVFLAVDGTPESAKTATGDVVKKVGSCTIYHNSNGYFVKTNGPLSGRIAWAGYFQTLPPAEKLANFAGLVLSALA